MATRTEKKDALESVACKRSNPLGIGERHGRKRVPFPRGRGPSPTRKKEDEIRPGTRKADSYVEQHAGAEITSLILTATFRGMQF
jgi:hypothetical protein